MISYKPLWETMRDRNITTYILIKDYGFSAQTINNLKHSKGITTFTLERLCQILNCKPNDIIEFVDT